MIEHRISPGDMLGAAGTLAAPTTPDVAFDLVGSRAMPLAVGDATLDFWLQPGTQTAWTMLGVILVIVWLVLTIAVALH